MRERGGTYPLLVTGRRREEGEEENGDAANAANLVYGFERVRKKARGVDEDHDS